MKTSITINADVAHHIKRRTEASAHGKTSRTINDDLRQYYLFVETGSRELRGTISDAELFALREVCQGMFMDTVTAPLDLIHEVEDSDQPDSMKSTLCNKLENLSIPAFLALLDQIRAAR